MREDLIAFLRERQDPYTRLSGAFKVVSFLVGRGDPVPRADRIARSTLWCLRLVVPDDFCEVRNPVDMNASAQALRTVRPALYAFAGASEPALEGRTAFLDELEPTVAG